MDESFRVPPRILESIYVTAEGFSGFMVCRECQYWQGNAHADDCRLGWLEWADRMLMEQTKSSTVMLAAIVQALGGSVQVLNADLVSIKPDDALVRVNEADRIVFTYKPSVR